MQKPVSSTHTSGLNIGTVHSVSGAVVDVVFASADLPPINAALIVEWDVPTLLMLEVHSHLDLTTVRAVAFQSTAGLARGIAVSATDGPVTVPVGNEVLGRLLDVVGNPKDDGRYHVGDKAIAVSDIRAPIFAVGTEDDHVAPWQSVYKMQLMADTDVTFVLTSGGHNAGIVSEPGHVGRHFRIAETKANAAYRAPDEWLAQNAAEEGSWWTDFAAWLAARSGEVTARPPMGAHSGTHKAICDAPGTYVMQR